MKLPHLDKRKAMLLGGGALALWLLTRKHGADVTVHIPATAPAGGATVAKQSTDPAAPIATAAEKARQLAIAKALGF